MSSYFKAPAANRRNPLFSFQGFEMYTARREDLWLAMLWTAMDPHHKDTTDPSFWIEHAPGIESYLMADRWGWIFFFRLERVRMCIGENEHMMVRVHIQFAPTKPTPAPANIPLMTAKRRAAAEPMNRERTMRGLILGCEWMERCLAPAGTSALCFDSENPALIRFCQKHMGFRRDGNWLIKWFATANHTDMSPGLKEKSGVHSEVQTEGA